MARIFIGVDVSKDHLDVHVRPNGDERRFSNDDEGIAKLLAFVRPFAAERIVFESTGPFQKAAVAALLTEQLPAVVVNARQVRDFAKAIGKLAKTDRIDASVIAHFAEVFQTTVKPLESQEMQLFRALNARRSQLVLSRAIEKNHLSSAKVARLPQAVLDNILCHIEVLSKMIRELEATLNQMVENCAAFKAKDEILQSITGIGPQISRVLLADLPELGTCSRQKIAALVGLAPFNDDSGNHAGARYIRGGRKAARCSLYQAAVAAIRHCRKTKAQYDALQDRGKSPKVAIVAIARKILVVANALVRDMVPHRQTANSVC